MLKAILSYVNKDTNKTVTLDSGSLYYIDEITKKCDNIDELKTLYNLGLNSKNDDIVLHYIKDLNKKEELPILINDSKPINIYNNLYENIESEVEKSRKLLFNSKNRMFLKSFLQDQRLRDTLNFSVNITFQEYKTCTEFGLNVYENNGNYYVRTLDLFKYISFCKKYGKLRTIFEDSLDLWKNRMISLDSDKLYYYSRNLRVLKNEYDKQVKNIITIKNLNIRNYNLFKYTKNEISKNNVVSTTPYVKIKKET